MQNNFTDEKNVTYLSVDKILPNPYQARKIFDSKALEELANSIKKYGVIKPITVRYIKNNIYEIISGERRLKACKMCGFSEVPVFIKNTNSKDSVIISLIENMQRENLNFFEEAESFQKLMVDFGCSIDDISKIIDKNQDFVLQKMQLLSLKKEIKNFIVENFLTEEHAICILQVKDFKTQIEILQKAVKYKLNPENTKKLIDSTLKNSESNQNKQKVKGIIRDVRIFTNTIKNAVDIMKDSGFQTNYDVIKNDNTYEISIKLSM